MGPCHHGKARPQVADGGTAYSMEGSCEYIEYAVADSRLGVVLQPGGWARCYKLPTVKSIILRTIHKGLKISKLISKMDEYEKGGTL